MARKWKPQDGSHLHSTGLPKVNMPRVRDYMTAKLANPQAVRLDKYCGVDAQSKPIFEDEQEANVPQTNIGLLDQTRNIIHTLSRLPFDSILMIAVETGRMKNSLSRRDIAQNERTAISAWQTFSYLRPHSRAANHRAATASVPGYGQHPGLESDDDAVDIAYEDSDKDSHGDSDVEETVWISSMETCCSTTSEYVGSNIVKQVSLNAPWTLDEDSHTPTKLGLPRSQMPLTETCPICETEDSDEIQAVITPCCGRFVHELCNDEELEETGRCWSCEKEQKSSSPSTAWTCSKADEYLVHFAASPERILENASSDFYIATSEQCPSLDSSASGEPDSRGPDALNETSPSYTPRYLEPEENKALENLESLKDYFLGLWTEVADKVTESDRVRIIQEVVTGIKVPVDVHTTKPMVPSSFQPRSDSESGTICENQSLQEKSHALTNCKPS